MTWVRIRAWEPATMDTDRPRRVARGTAGGFMAYTEFTLESVEADLGVIPRPGPVFGLLPDAAPPAWLPGQLARGMELALVSEKARSEFIVAPILLAVRELSGGRVASVRDLVGKRAVKRVRLDPARIATLYGQKQEERRLVRIDEVPQQLTDTLQAVEDRDFAHHIGIDFSGIARALWVWIKTRGEVMQGASTLTQQLARSGLLGIGKEQTPTRKFNEVLYALIIDARYDKGVILEAYLNQVDIGQNGSQAIHGFAAGAEYYFGRQLDELNTEQIALLVGLVKGPSWYNPRRNPERATERRKEIGILKSLGASKSFIVTVIESEAFFIGVLGVLFGFLISIVASVVLQKVYDQLAFEFSLGWILTAILIAIGGSLFGALYPAWKASGIDPVEVMVNE